MDGSAGGWFNLQDAFGPHRFEQAVSLPGAAGFTVGMPNYPAIYAIRAGLEYIHSVGVEAIFKAAQPLAQACLEGVSKLPVELLTPLEKEHLVGILAFRHPKADEIHRYLHEANIHIMAHARRLRVSIHGYNTLADVERFLQKLEEALTQL
ncbi:MAG: aminotransferase class V-fold PLP-dependent enzyme [Anaerolineae bacterium]